MERQPQHKQTELIEKSILLTIPSCVAGATLKNIQQKDIKCEYLGVEQSGDLIMKLSYLQWQEQYLEKIIEEMNVSEAQMSLLLLIVGKIAIDSYVDHKLSEINLNKPIKKYQRHEQQNGSN